MIKEVYQEKLNGVVFTSETLRNCHYEEVEFVGCIFNDVNFIGLIFEECQFIDCNFTGAHLNETAFRSVVFDNCKLIGLNFESVNTFQLKMDFLSCILDLASFYMLSLKNTKFDNSSLKDADFSRADLTKSSFNETELRNTVFSNTNLSECDFRTGKDFTIDPSNNKMTKAKFERHNIEGLLRNYKLVIS